MPSAAILLVVGSGVYVLRGSDVSNYLSFLGVTSPTKTASSGVQTGSQRAHAALWIGWKIFEDHPLLGVGFQRSGNRYQPYLAAAKRKFPNQPAQAYPSPQNQWGVQNWWVELLADTGVVGFALRERRDASRTGLSAGPATGGALHRSSRSSRPAGSWLRPAPGTPSGSSPASHSTR